MSTIYLDFSTDKAPVDSRAAKLLRTYREYTDALNFHGATTWIKNLSMEDQDLLILTATKRVEV